MGLSAALLLLLSVAAPRPLVVIASVQGATGPEQTQALEALAGAEAQVRPGIERLVAVDHRADVRRCGAEPKCLAQVLGPTGATLALLIVADYRITPALFGLTLVDLAERRVLGVTSVDLDATTPGQALSAPIRGLFDNAGLRAGALIETRIEPAGATVVLDPAPLRSDGATHWLTPGRYTLKVSRDGYLPSESHLAVAGADRRTVLVRLAEEPGLSKPLLVGGLVLVVAGVVAVVAAAVVGAGAGCLCAGGPEACQDGCAGP